MALAAASLLSRVMAFSPCSIALYISDMIDLIDSTPLLSMLNSLPRELASLPISFSVEVMVSLTTLSVLDALLSILPNAPSTFLDAVSALSPICSRAFPTPLILFELEPFNALAMPLKASAVVFPILDNALNLLLNPSNAVDMLCNAASTLSSSSTLLCASASICMESSVSAIASP